MENNEKDLNDYQEQYDLLIEEEKEKQKKKTFWILFFCLIIILFSVLGATYSYYRVYVGAEKNDLNIDTDGDGIPDLNIDTNGDGKCDVNCDKDKNRKPYLNVSLDKKQLDPLFNLDTDKDGVPDKNLMNQDTDGDGTCDLNCDTNGDGFPDKNIDLDGDGICDLYCDTIEDGKCTLNCDTDGDGICDLNCDSKEEEGCTLNCDTDGDGNCDKNCDTDGDGTCDLNCDDEPIVDVKNAILHVYYKKDVTALNVAPGWKDILRFTVENQSNKTMVFDIEWVDVLNEFHVDKTLTYSLFKDGMLKSQDIPVPKANTKLLEGIVIPANQTYLYEIEYHFNDLPDVDQTMDLGKSFTAKLEVKNAIIMN